MLSYLLRWCVAVVFAHAGNLHGREVWAEPVTMTDGHRPVVLLPVVRQGLEQPVT
jgi:hypothetical protein